MKESPLHELVNLGKAIIEMVPMVREQKITKELKTKIAPMKAEGGVTTSKLKAHPDQGTNLDVQDL